MTNRQANRFALDDRSLRESLGSTGPGQYEARAGDDIISHLLAVIVLLPEPVGKNLC